ncbi:MAG: amidohydrolase family protein, partial [Caulobacteraceae bacterium]
LTSVGIGELGRKDPVARKMGAAKAYCRAYNRWQKDFFAASKGRVVPIALVNWRDVEEAERELAACLKAGFRGVFAPPETVDGRRPSDPHFDPIWRLCEEAGVPGCFHVIVRFEPSAAPFAQWGNSHPGPLFGFALGGTGQLIPALAAAITDLLFERFPRLKVLSVEAGCGHAAYLMDRLDSKAEVFHGIAPMPMKPSDYIRRNCWFVAEPAERTIGAMLDLVGEEKICWGSDYPHVDSSLDAATMIRRSLGELSPGRRAGVLGENARRLFDL